MARSGNEPWQLTAEELWAYLLMGRVNPLDIVESSLRRIDQVNPTLNAVIDVYDEEAIEVATRLKKSRKRLPNQMLRGLPVTIKDNIESAGHAMSEGVPALKDNVCAEDAPLVARLKGNGAIIVGRTNCPPHCWQLFGTNELYGTTINPRNAALTSGGSSSGAAVSVASGMVPIAQGNDIAGSIRYPAYANGIVGLRPTNGLIAGSDTTPADKPFTFQLFASQGVLARTVDDAWLGFDGMKGYAPGDPASIECAMSYEHDPKTVGVYLGTDIADIADPVEEAVLHAARALEAHGWKVEYVSTDVFRRLFEVEIEVMFGEFLRPGAHEEEKEQGGEILRRGLAGVAGVLADLRGDGYVSGAAAGAGAGYAGAGVAEGAGAASGAGAGYAGAGYALTLDDYLAGLARRGSAVRDLRKLMDRYPVILTPASAQTPFLRDEDQTCTPARAKEMAYASWPMDVVPAAGLPAVALPTDVVADGVNLGVQLIARAYDEITLKKAALDVERYFDLDHSPVDPA